MRRRLKLGEKVSSLDPVANIATAVGYIRWLFERYEAFSVDIDERMKCALFALDVGYFRTKFALEKCVQPATFEQVAALVGYPQDAEMVRKIAKESLG